MTISTTSRGATKACEGGAAGASAIVGALSIFGVRDAQPTPNAIVAASATVRTTRALSFGFVVTRAT